VILNTKVLRYSYGPAQRNSILVFEKIQQNK